MRARSDSRLRRHAPKSLRLGEAIGWERNTAFCLKCTGRLARLQAEKRSIGTLERDGYLEESLRLLQAAVEAFVKSSEFGLTHSEVGDCYSLIARTYLVARKYEAAQDALRKAHELIPADGRKDHLDLLILTGDLEAAQGRRQPADHYYSEAIKLPQAADVQLSEMFARAYFQRAVGRVHLRRTGEAILDYRKARDIWRDVEEHEQAARAEWEARLLEHKVSSDLREVLETDASYLVRITVHDEYLSQRPAATVIARRKELPRAQVQQLLKDARRTVAINYSRV